MSVPQNILESGFDAKSQCCGCGACVQVCSKNAIKMQEDDEGFLYPMVEADGFVRAIRKSVMATVLQKFLM